MTATTTSVAPARSTARLRLAGEVAESVCALAAVVGLGWVLWHSGGRDRGAVDVGLLLTAPMLVVSRPWRRLRLVELLVGSAVVIAAVIIPAITTMGVADLRDMNAYPYAVAVYFGFRAYASTGPRQRLVGVAVLVLAAMQFVPVWRVWVDQHNSAYMMVGTIYWHNQFGAFAMCIGLYGAAMAMRSHLIDDYLGWLVGALFIALTVLSHSRGAELALSVGAVLLALAALRVRNWPALVRLAGVAVLSAAIVAGFMAAAHLASGGSGTRPQAIAPDSLSSTSNLRWGLIKAAWHVLASAPYTSHGFGSFLVLEPRFLPIGATMSRWVHSGELQALTDGGLLLAVPVVLAIALVVIRGLRATFALARRVDDDGNWTRLGAGVAAVALVVHMTIDFDTQYPILLGLLAVFGVLAMTPAAQERRSYGASPGWLTRRAAFTFAVAAAVTASLMVGSYWHTRSGLIKAEAVRTSDPAAAAGQATHLMNSGAFIDPRPAIYLVQLQASGVSVAADDLRRALHRSRDYAGLDRDFAPVWQRVNSQAGSPSNPIKLPASAH